MASVLSNLTFQIKETITTSKTTGDTFKVTNDLERDQVISAVNASIVLKDELDRNRERMIVSISGGVATIVKRGLDQSTDEVEVSALKKERRTGATGYITQFASDVLDITNDGYSSNIYGDVTFKDDVVVEGISVFQDQVGITGPLLVSGTTSYIKFPILTTTQRNALTASNGMIVYDTSLGLFYQYKAGAWASIDTGTSTGNATTSVSGSVELATQAEFGAGTASGSAGPLTITPDLVSPRLLQSGTIAGSFNSNTTSTVTHNLGVSQADVEVGRYTVFFSFNVTGTGVDYGYYRQNINNSNIETSYHKRDSGDPSVQYAIHWQANTFKVYFTPGTMATSGVVTDIRYYILQVY